MSPTCPAVSYQRYSHAQPAAATTLKRSGHAIHPFDVPVTPHLIEAHHAVVPVDLHLSTLWRSCCLAFDKPILHAYARNQYNEPSDSIRSPPADEVSLCTSSTALHGRADRSQPPMKYRRAEHGVDSAKPADGPCAGSPFACSGALGPEKLTKVNSTSGIEPYPSSTEKDRSSGAMRLNR
jgi:hypothetical protein